MRIGIDARFYGPTGKGLGRYTQELVDNIILLNKPENGQVFDYVVFLSPDNFDELKINSQNLEKIKISCPWYSWQEQFLMPKYLKKANLDLVHFPHFNVPIFYFKPFIVTIHDLILTHFPTFKATTKSRLTYFFKNIAYRLTIFSALKRAKKIIAVSEFTKNDIISEFGISEKKIIVTYEGITFLDNRDDSAFIKKLDNHESLLNSFCLENFLLYVGSAYPHKNLEKLLNVFKKLKEENNDLCLVLAGRPDYFNNRLKDRAKEFGLLDNKPNVFFVGHVSDKDLANLYRKAKAFIFPSFYEGFGLPPLEAMANSCPVLSSNRASLPEILSSAALYFNPDDENDILEKIKILINDENLKQSLITKGLIHIKKYSWQNCASLTRDIYLSILSSK